MTELAISALFALGPITYDQHATREAIARTIGDWKGQNIWVESRFQNPNHNEPAASPSTATSISAVSPSGRYFFEKQGSNPARITCYCDEGAFTVQDIQR